MCLTFFGLDNLFVHSTFVFFSCVFVAVFRPYPGIGFLIFCWHLCSRDMTRLNGLEIIVTQFLSILFVSSKFSSAGAALSRYQAFRFLILHPH